MTGVSASVCLLLAMCAMATASSVWPAGTPDGVPSVRARTVAPKTISTQCFASRLVNVAAAATNPTTPTFCTEPTPLCPAGDYQRFSANGVKSHFENQPPGFPMADVRRTTFSCVDARGDEPMLGTPGGDLSEVMMAAMALMKVTRNGYSDTIADEVLSTFFNNVATPTRPLYFHTDDSRLRSMFAHLKTVLGGEQPTVMPFRGPSTDTARAAWLNALASPEFNGCGHIRLQMQPTEAKLYSIVRAGDTAATTTNCANLATITSANCIDSAVLAKRIVRGFFNYWWFTATGSAQRQRVNFAVDGILVGPLLGKAVTVIKNQATAGTSQHNCANHAPLVRPLFGASKVFVYHADAVAAWRTHAANNGLRTLLAKYNVGSTKIADFVEVWNRIAGLQLDATLKNLAPAKDVGVFTVNVPVGGSSSLASQSAEALTTPEEPVALPVVVTAAVPEPVAAAAAAEPVEPVADLEVPATGVEAVVNGAVVTESGR